MTVLCILNTIVILILVKIVLYITFFFFDTFKLELKLLLISLISNSIVFSYYLYFSNIII